MSAPCRSPASTSTQIEQRIVEQLKGKAQDPQVIVEFVADRTHTVMVSGDVKNPGRVSILEGVRSVVDAINRAGGPAMRRPHGRQAISSKSWCAVTVRSS